MEDATGCRLLLTPRPVALPVVGGHGGGPRVRQVACGWEHTVYLTDDGGVWVAGRGSRGQLGLGPGPEGAVAAQPRPLTGSLAAALPAGWRVICVAAGMWHTLFAAAAAAAAPQPPAASAAGGGADGEAAGAGAATAAAAAAAAAAAGAAMAASADPGAAGSWRCSGASEVILGCGSNRRRQLGACGQLCRAEQRGEPASSCSSGASAGGGGGGLAAAVAGLQDAGTRRRGLDGGRGNSGGGKDEGAAPPASAWTPVLVHAVPRGACTDGGGAGAVTAATNLVTAALLQGAAGSGFGSGEGASQPSRAALVTVAAGGDRSAYLDGAGRLFMWGRGMPPAAQDSGAPVEVRLPPQSGAAAAHAGGTGGVSAAAVAHKQRAEPEIAAWRQVALGWQHVLALDTCGRVWAWGSNRNGQLARPPPAPSAAGSAAISIATATGTQALRTAAAAIGQRATEVSRPQEVGGVVAASAVPLCVPLPDAAACVAAGSEHCAAVVVDGSVFTWGWGEHGMLGTGDMHSRWQPQRVCSACSAVACGAGFTVCA
ncbi:hypothetical protein HYH02_004533 [Chlamydomonas schloesseri]|uniref:Uncharacterized protein n=1 Tax=Chlamydomonas schloesseri TaxID=2026947 RepID=A0A835WNV8_9CHLO|nr:hypothetical protein HYH02_004533 [Chlamydomonas schloesseri]|eukprot:KAG2450694.1 hypothetical protein HYH02_004533 [Chlamydomonas schloesseri]